MKRITPTLFFALWGCTENQLHGPEGKAGAGGCETPVAVSYTHLTLPTILRV